MDLKTKKQLSMQKLEEMYSEDKDIQQKPAIGKRAESLKKIEAMYGKKNVASRIMDNLDIVRRAARPSRSVSLTSMISAFVGFVIMLVVATNIVIPVITTTTTTIGGQQAETTKQILGLVPLMLAVTFLLMIIGWAVPTQVEEKVEDDDGSETKETKSDGEARRALLKRYVETE